MNLPASARRLLSPDPRDVGCSETFDHVDRYVEALLAGREHDPLYTGVTAHLRGCGPCREDFEGLIAAVRAEGNLVGTTR